MMNTKNCAALEEEIRALNESLQAENEHNNQYRQVDMFHVDIDDENSTTDCDNKGKSWQSKKRCKYWEDTEDKNEQKTPKKTSKLKVATTELVSMDVDIDQQLEEKAERNNLTVYNVKNILRNIIIDEDFLKIISGDHPKPSIPYEPKLTRAKRKEMEENHQELPWLNVTPSKVQSSSSRILIEEDLPDDSSDDEYKPNEDDQDLHSDEESFISSHASDIGSPAPSIVPSTPSSNHYENVFKKPLPIESNQEDLIVHRTRSKLPLTNTSLELLEMAFVPPDITTDMYDSDCNNDPEWKRFLWEYVCPPTQQPDDEETDPEYNILEEEEELDREELRADKGVRISKSEVRVLLSDLFDDQDFSADDDEETHGKLDTQVVAEPAPLQQLPHQVDLLQTALEEIIEPVPMAPLPAPKPTGIVAPYHAAGSQPLIMTIQFPTLGLDCEMEIQPQHAGHQRELGAGTLSYSAQEMLPPESRLRLEEQLRQHVQLLTQGNLIMAQQPELVAVADEFRAMLVDLKRFDPRHVNIANLNEALDLTARWKEHISVRPTPLHPVLNSYVRPVAEKGNKKKFVRRRNYHPDRYPFDEDMVEMMMDNRVFCQPQMLPKLALFQVGPAPCMPSTHEEQLIAMGLEQFTPFCSRLFERRSEAAIRSTTNQLISHYMLPHWDESVISGRITRLMKPSVRSNPIQYWKEHGVAPPLPIWKATSFDWNSMPKLRDVSPECLPERWRLLVLSKSARYAENDDPPSTGPENSESVTDRWHKECRRSSLFNIRPHLQVFDSLSTPLTSPRRPRTKRRNRSLARQESPTAPKPGRRSGRLQGQPEEADVIQVPKRKRLRRRSPVRPNSSAEMEPALSVSSSEVRPDYSPNEPTGTETVSDGLAKRKPGRPRKRILVANGSGLMPSARSKHRSARLPAEDALPNLNSLTQSVEVSPSTRIVKGNYVGDGSTTSQVELSTTTESVDALPVSDQVSSVNNVVDVRIDDDRATPLSQPESFHADSEPEPVGTEWPDRNRAVKRFVLMKRDASGTNIMHVWGPKALEGSVIPVRMVADHVDPSADTASSTTSNQDSSQSGSRANRGVAAAVIDVAGRGGTVSGGSGGDDGDDKQHWRDEKFVGDAIDMMLIDDDDEEEEGVPLGLDPTATPPAARARSAPAQKPRSPTHRLAKHQRNARRILDSWMADDDNVGPGRNTSYAQAYFCKVTQVLKQDNPVAYNEFLTALKDFESQLDSIPLKNLYAKVEEILKPYPDLLDEFVNFLSPEDAALCGRQFEFYLYCSMREFFSKLKIHFKDKPAQLRRVLKALQQVESSESPTVNDIKHAILPLLKGNSLLTQTFLQLFPDDSPPLPSTAMDYEKINLEQHISGDEFEYVDLTEDATAQPCQAKDDLKSVRVKNGSKNNLKGSRGKGKAHKK